MTSSKAQIRQSLIKTIERLGYPEEFAILIADSLGTEKQMTRMVSWIIQFKPKAIEEIADEMLAIKEDFKKYRDKKIAEYYNIKYNELLNSGPLDQDDSVPLGCYMLGEFINVKVIHPIGSFDGDQHYLLNFGIAEDYMDGNGEFKKVCLIGCNNPVESFIGKVIAIFANQDTEEELWVIAPAGYIATKDEIASIAGQQININGMMLIM